MSGNQSADFGDAALHDEEIRVVDVKLDTLKDGLDDVLLCLVTV
jgi:hypothetical protein